ncbi:MAG: sensor histidine kinase [Microcystaceae cyanobacterium]
MPTLTTERLSLSQVFANLIGNAFKHHERADGRVKISVIDRGNCYQFAVSDDGTGIAPENHERIFAIFQTLRASDNQENTGIGLAIVKKIV